MLRKVALSAALACLGLWPGTSTAQVGRPVPVSPGETGKIVRIADRCPSFDWAVVSGATSLQLVVYRLEPAGDGRRELGQEPVLAVDLPAAAQGWTPSLDRCLDPGGSYGWSIRALGPKVDSGWAEVRLFEVAAEPTALEVRAALDVLRRFVEAAPGDAGAARSSAAGNAKAGTETDAPTGDEAAGRPAEPRALTQVDSMVATAFVGDGSALTGVVAASAAGLTCTSCVELDALAFDTATEDELTDHRDTGEHAHIDVTYGNAALGEEALNLVAGGQDNVAIGRNALSNNTTGSYNTAVGAAALSGTDSGYANTALGAYALEQNTGQFNTAVGAYSLANDDYGYGNTAVGAMALQLNTTGESQVAVGYRALQENTTGGDNTALGWEAMVGMTAGDANTAVGSGALENLSYGHRNTAIGWNAGRDVLDGSHNLTLDSYGVYGESNTIWLGNPAHHYRLFAAGVAGSTIAGQPVVVDGAGQLGVTDSLDADTLEGMDSTAFAPAVHAHDWTSITNRPAGLDDGDDTVPRGTIVAFYGDSVPAGWGLCNGGTYTDPATGDPVTTPDLRDRFIYGRAAATSSPEYGGDDDHNHVYTDYILATHPSETSSQVFYGLKGDTWYGNGHRVTIQGAWDGSPEPAAVHTFTKTSHNTVILPQHVRLAFIMKL